MKLFRVVLYVMVVFGIIYSWDNFGRDFFVKNFQNVVAKEESITIETPKMEENIIQEEKISELPSENNTISFEKGFENVAKKAMHSVVNVATMQLVEASERPGLPDIFKGLPFDEMFKDFFDVPQKKQKLKKANALGSGFIVEVDKKAKKAYVVTNNHVVEKAKKIIVSLSDKTELPATIHAVDSRTDIAVLAIDLKNLDFNIEKLKSVIWGDSSKLNEGNFVIAIGNPFGLGSTVTNGIVSAKGRNLSMGMPSLNFIDDFIQHSAPINFGNSGGCLLNIYGEVIGINNAIFSTSGGNIGIGFAIPSNIAKNTVDQLIKFKRTFRGWLGAEVHSVYAKQAESVGLAKHSLESSKIFGAYVARVVPNGPAAKCGIKVGDIIVEFNGKRISENCSLQNAVGTAEIGKSVKLKIWRQKDNSTWGMTEISVKIGDFEKAMQSGELDTKTQEETRNADVIKETYIDSLGITISTLPEQYKSEYPKGLKVVVTKVEDDEGPSFYGPIFKVGDGFISADNKQVTSVSQMKGIIENILKDKNNRNRPIPFVVARGGSQMMIATTLDFAAKENDEK